jgi:ubiquinol-cytochrome c reductase iron-sulfur subunit
VKRGWARIAGAMLAWALFLRRAGRPRPEEVEPDPRTYEPQSHPRAEMVVIVSMLLACLCGLSIPFIYIFTSNTQQLGGLFGAALALAGFGAAVAGKMIVPHEIQVEERAQLDHPEVQEEIEEEFQSAGDGVTRRGALKAAAGAAGAGICVAAAVPLFEFGPKVGQIINSTPWKAGRHLVNLDDQRVKAADVSVGEFLTLFPEGADKELVGSAVGLLRLSESDIHIPPSRRTWTPQGLMAFSKICTHAGCAVNMFRYPLSPGTTPAKPALVCPCHYSTFDVGHAAKVIFGPAGRPLPQLPLAVDPQGYILAAGNLSGPPGPAWWSVREQKTK